MPPLIERTVSHPKENTTIQTYDVKQDRKVLYGPKSGVFESIDVPALAFLMIDGHGDPNTSSAYREAV